MTKEENDKAREYLRSVYYRRNLKITIKEAKEINMLMREFRQQQRNNKKELFEYLE